MNTFDAWKESIERNEEIDRANAKKDFNTILIKALLLLPFLYICLSFFLRFAPKEGLAEDGSNVGALALSIASFFLIPIVFVIIIVVTPSFFTRQKKEDTSKLRAAWAKVHGLDSAGELPAMESYLCGVKEQVFTQRYDNVLKTYRLVSESGTGVLYDADGNRVDSKASAVNTTVVSVDDPNSELWQAAAKPTSQGE